MMKKAIAAALAALMLAACSGGGDGGFVVPADCDAATDRIQVFYRDVTSDLGEAAGHPEWNDLMKWGEANCGW